MTVLERGWLSSNNVVFDGRHGTAVVDTGYVAHSAQTVALVQRALNGKPLERVCCTHLHSDHCGGNAALKRAFPAVRTFIPPGLAQAVARWDEVALTYQPTGQACERFSADAFLQPDTTIGLGDHEWQIHAAPGHDPHSVILFEPASRTLLSADALWENGFGVVFPELEGESAFGDVARTLDLIEALAPSRVVPGHGSEFAGEKVASAMSHARSRLDSFVRDPVRHARHAAKVLLKYKLLELQDVPLLEFMGWASRTPYFALVFGRYFAEGAPHDWLLELIEDLVRSGAAKREDDRILNH
jgi:glyoxylase-like metal-dependent hydrolase (beta-lactamase superfamily II)